MTRTPAPSAFTRWLIIGNLLTIALIVAIVARSVHESERQHRELALARVENIAQVLDRYVTSLIDKGDLALKTVLLQFGHELTETNSNAGIINTFLATQLSHIPELDSIRIAGPEGVIRYSAEGARPVSVADRAFFQRLRDHREDVLSFSEPMLGRITGKWVIAMGRRITLPNGKFGGTAIVTISSEQLREAFGAVDLGANGAISLRTDDLFLVARHPAPPGDGNGGLGTNAVSAQLQDMVRTSPLSGNYVAQTALDGIERQNAYRRVGGYPFYIIVGISTDTWRSAARSDAMGEISLGLLAIVVTLTLSRLLLNDWRRREVAVAELARESTRSELTLRNASDGLHIIDSDGNVLQASDSFCAMLGRSHEEILRSNVREWDVGFPAQELQPRLNTLIRSPDNTIFETRHRRKDGSEYDAELHVRSVAYDGKPALFCSARDITERKSAELALRVNESRLNLATEAGEVGLWDLDIASEDAWRSKRHDQIFGYADGKGQWSLRRFLDHVAPADRSLVDDRIRAAHVSGHLQFECRIIRTDGEARWITVRAEVFRNNAGAATRMIGTVMDVTDRKRDEAELQNANRALENLAVRDDLTGLFNRRYMDETVAREIREADRRGHPISFIMLDIDLFKQVNDSLGHMAGDRVLEVLGAMMRDNIRGEDIACRYGGEEFLLVLPHASPQMALTRAEELRQLAATLRVPFEGREITLTLSAGVATYPADGMTGEVLIAAADAALYAAKRAGRNCVRVAST